MTVDSFYAWSSGLRYVRRNVELRLHAAVPVFSCAITLMLTEHRSAAIVQLVERYLERNTAS
ncbi:hypothetical protein OKW43_007247 [Paraburkholderia sp. WC7.3g]|uniref:Uncharacterized protein n=1 Tax=Paraburkholderia podalyriae TaxID=1938811 RepID=A0ABR7PJI3_9BURK|nr:hypothetical protein [Paraburkholderia podalyriae]MBC8746536.1 hypothetical protein [Paraburkholderia podalyriae]